MIGIFLIGFFIIVLAAILMKFAFDDNKDPILFFGLLLL